MPQGYEAYAEYEDGKLFLTDRDERQEQTHGLFLADEWSVKAANGEQEVVKHGWATRCTKAALEFYPQEKLPDGTYNSKWGNGFSHGCVRMEIANFSHPAHDGWYCNPPVGTIPLPARKDIDVLHQVTGRALAIYLNGFFHNAHNVPITGETGRFTIRLFQQGSSISDTLTNTGAYWVRSMGFAATNNDGYWYAGPLYPGAYDFYIVDNKTGQFRIVHRFSAVSTRTDFWPSDLV